MSFSFETVMSHPSKVEIVRRARTLGFRVIVWFVAIEGDGTDNVARVKQRAASGGHDVPADRVKARHGRTMSLLLEAVRAAEIGLIFDNTYATADRAGGSPLRLIAQTASDGDRITVTRQAGDVPAWAMRYLLNPIATEQAPSPSQGDRGKT